MIKCDGVLTLFDFLKILFDFFAFSLVLADLFCFLFPVDAFKQLLSAIFFDVVQPILSTFIERVNDQASRIVMASGRYP